MPGAHKGGFVKEVVRGKILREKRIVIRQGSRMWGKRRGKRAGSLDRDISQGQKVDIEESKVKKVGRQRLTMD